MIEKLRDTISGRKMNVGYDRSFTGNVSLRRQKMIATIDKSTKKKKIQFPKIGRIIIESLGDVDGLE